VLCWLLQGLLNGREIFLQDNFVAQDDVNAGGADEYAREDDEEARINDMFDQVRGGGDWAGGITWRWVEKGWAWKDSVSSAQCQAHQQASETASLQTHL
jgi:hypothetical protein